MKQLRLAEFSRDADVDQRVIQVGFKVAVKSKIRRGGKRRAPGWLSQAEVCGGEEQSQNQSGLASIPHLISDHRFICELLSKDPEVIE